MRENLTYGSMRGSWKPGMASGIEALPERDKEQPPGTWSHGASFLLYRDRSQWVSSSFRTISEPRARVTIPSAITIMRIAFMVSWALMVPSSNGSLDR